MIRPYNLVAWGLAGAAALAFFWDGTLIHAAVVILIACGVRFVGTDRVWTASAACCACIVTFPSVIFLLGGDYVHAVVIAATLTNVVPMFRFAMNGRLDVLYSKF